MSSPSAKILAVGNLLHAAEVPAFAGVLPFARVPDIFYGFVVDSIHVVVGALQLLASLRFLVS
jgi:hypothetical protein